MTQIVPQAMPPKAANGVARKGAELPADGGGFGEALQGQSRKPGKEIAGDPARPPLPAALRIRASEHGFTPRLLTDSALTDAAMAAPDDGSRFKAYLKTEGRGQEAATWSIPDGLLQKLAAAPEQTELPEADQPETEKDAVTGAEPALFLAASAGAPLAIPAAPLNARVQAFAPAAAEGQPVDTSHSGEPATGNGIKLALSALAIHPAEKIVPANEGGARQQHPVFPSGEPGQSAEAPARGIGLPDGPRGLALGLRETVPAAARRADQASMPEGVRVLGVQGLPAPAQLPSPAVSVVQAIGAAPDWTPVERSAPTLGAAIATPGAGPLKSLTIQLHPAELGSVTARLQFAGDQLSIELQVEKAEAYDRLVADRDAILKAVRALGIEVDRVTVQQPGAQNAAQSRADNAPSFAGGTGRDAEFTPGGSSGRESGGAAGNRPGRAENETASGRSKGGQDGRSGNARDLYI